MRAYLRDTIDEEFRERYYGVGAGTTGARRVVVERGEADTKGAAPETTPTQPTQRFTSAETARTQPQVDRLKQQARDATRNVRIESTDSSAVTGRQSIDQEFSDSYAKAGLQPTGLVGPNSANTGRKKYEQPDQLTRRVEKEYRREQRAAAKPARSKIIRIKKKKDDSLMGDVLARGRATRANIFITSWGLWWWWTLQVPLVLLHLAAIGLAGALMAVLGVSSGETSEDEGFLAKVAGEIVTWARSLLDAVIGVVSNWLGIDLTIFDPESWVSMTYMMSYLFALTALFSMYLMYTFSRIDAFGGKGGAIKKGAFLIALCGYAVPIANLLPWFLVWAIAVWFYPK